MRQVVQNYKTGELKIEQVPPPILRPGGVLVRNAFSVISAGTERGKIELGQKNLLAKARARPDQLKQVMQNVTSVSIEWTFGCQNVNQARIGCPTSIISTATAPL